MENSIILIKCAVRFICSHLVEQLLMEECTIRAFVNYNSLNTWGWLDTFTSEKLNQLEIFTSDIRDPNGVRTAIKGIDIVLNLTALIAIPFSYYSPDSYIYTNVKGTLNIIQAAKDQGVERVLVTITSEVYGTASYVSVTDEHPKQPQTPYSASKIGADCIADSFFPCLDLTITIVQPFNTFDPRQSGWLR